MKPIWPRGGGGKGYPKINKHMKQKNVNAKTKQKIFVFFKCGGISQKSDSIMKNGD